MKKNSIEELKQRLEELHKTQQARLDVGADDLDIREEIAEVEEKIKELWNATNKENSIEEDMGRIAKLITTKFNNDYSIDNKDKEAIEHILSDYKRALKENEALKEESKEAWDEWNNLEQESYETEQKLKQQVKRLQKENEELKNEIEEKELEIIGKEEYTKASMREIIEQYYTANEDCVPTQKIKYLIDERAFEVYTRDYGNIDVVDVDSLNELLEESEEDK